jgi:YD repeat-containing protein
MTDQEKRQQRVNLGIEIEDAQGEFVHLREKALSLADRLGEITKKVRDNAAYKPSKADFDPEFEMGNKLEPRHQTVLDYDAFNRLIEELRAARKKLYNLYERKSQLSNGDFSVIV